MNFISVPERQRVVVASRLALSHQITAFFTQREQRFGFRACQCTVVPTKKTSCDECFLLNLVRLMYWAACLNTYTCFSRGSAGSTLSPRIPWGLFGLCRLAGPQDLDAPAAHCNSLRGSVDWSQSLASNVTTEQQLECERKHSNWRTPMKKRQREQPHWSLWTLRALLARIQQNYIIAPCAIPD